MKLTPQQEKILELHRSMDWVCSTAYEFIRDHRKRISELNTGYLKEKGYVLATRKCDGRCGKNHNSMVAMRRAEKISTPRNVLRNIEPQEAARLVKEGKATYIFPQTPSKEQEVLRMLKDSKEMVENFARI